MHINHHEVSVLGHPSPALGNVRGGDHWANVTCGETERLPWRRAGQRGHKDAIGVNDTLAQRDPSPSPIYVPSPGVLLRCPLAHLGAGNRGTLECRKAQGQESAGGKPEHVPHPWRASLREVHGIPGLGFRPFRTMGQKRPYQVRRFPGRVRPFLECLASLVSQGQSDPMGGGERTLGRQEVPGVMEALLYAGVWAPAVPRACLSGEQPTS